MAEPQTAARPRAHLALVPSPRPPAANKGKRFPAEALRRSEVERLIEAFADPRYAAMATLMWRLGLRCGETCSLRRCDLDLDQRTLRVIKPKGAMRKNKPTPPRMLGVDAIALRSLTFWLEHRDPALGDGGPLFHGRTGKPPEPRVVRRQLEKARQRAGLRYRRVHCHMLRHTFAYEKIMEGRTLPWIKQTLGHSDLLTTQKYCDHLAPTEILEDMKEMV